MQRLAEFVYSYQNMVTTDNAVTRHYLLLRCLPCVNEFQSLVESRLIHFGFDELKKGQDSFGNCICYGGALKAHRTLSWQSMGIVRQSLYELEAEWDIDVFKYPSALCVADERVLALRDSLHLPKDPMEQALCLTEVTHKSLQYVKNVTDNKTTAAAALALGHGVCQDFAHVLITLARSLNLPARYVNGLIAGDGKTHAWVEILINNKWYGFDPTHNKKIEYGYVKLAHGRDANDCPVCRGVFTGQAEQQMSAHVLVGEL